MFILSFAYCTFSILKQNYIFNFQMSVLPREMLEREKKYKKYHQMNPLKILLMKVLLTVMMIVKSQFIEQKKSLSVRMIMRWRKRRKRKK